MAISTDYERKMRAAEIVKKTVLQGKTKAETAREMGISVDTLQRTIHWADQAQLFVEYEKRLLDELLPLAHEAVKSALQDGDAQVGLKILEGIRLLNKGGSKTKAQEEDEEGLYAEIARVRAGQIVDVTPRWRLEAGSAAIVEAGNQPDVVPGGVPEQGVLGEPPVETIEGASSPETVEGPTEKHEGE